VIARLQEVDAIVAHEIDGAVLLSQTTTPSQHLPSAPVNDDDFTILGSQTQRD
jgi:hypothetical protein